MIGALAIVTILASLLVPVVVRQIDQAAWTQEVGNLGAISNAIVLQALRNKVVSSSTTWASDAALWANMAVSSITTTPRGYARAFLVDPGGWLGNVTLPYTQSIAGVVISTSARILIVSTIAKDLPVSTRASVSAGEFND